MFSAVRFLPQDDMDAEGEQGFKNAQSRWGRKRGLTGKKTKLLKTEVSVLLLECPLVTNHCMLGEKLLCIPCLCQASVKTQGAGLDGPLI